MNRLGSALLRISLILLAVSLGHSAESLGDAQAVAGDAPQRTLDLRLPDSLSLRAPDPRQPDTSSESDEEAAATVVARRLLLDQRVDTKPSLGIGSLYWAVRHPTQAWRVFLPILPDGDETDSKNRGRAAELTTAEMLSRQRDVSVKPAPTVLAGATDANVSAGRVPETTYAQRAESKVVQTAGSHSVHVSKPKVVAALITQAAREAE